MNKVAEKLLPWAFVGIVAIVLFFVFRPEPKEEVLTYESVEKCVAAGVQDESTCQSEFDKAKALHEEVAPRYQLASTCREDFGGRDRCYQQQTSTGSFWLPFMVGYMLAPRGSTGVFSQPLYRPGRDANQFYTSGGVGVGTVSRDGRAQVAKSQVSQPRARTATVARGGFGARSMSAGS